ncbi:MAG: nucleoside triphosphate hydrolase [Alphaproteobacteria bacterium]
MGDLETAFGSISRLLDKKARMIVAIAGPPGAGKSTVAEALVDRLDQRIAPGTAAVLPMDGFHYDNAILEPRGLMPRKGAPETFDFGGYQAMVERLVTRSDQPVAVPVFDRVADLAHASARMIEPTHRVVVTEGNYLLLDDAPWRALRALFDLTIFLAVTSDELERRLVKRWLDYGMAPDAALARARGNDLRNARLVETRSAAADLTIDTNGGGVGAGTD